MKELRVQGPKCKREKSLANPIGLHGDTHWTSSMTSLTWPIRQCDRVVVDNLIELPTKPIGACYPLGCMGDPGSSNEL